jgi:hypothetical protein
MTPRPISVRIEKPKHTLASTMADIRTWLDAHKVEPAGLTVEPSDAGVFLHFRFQRQEEAELSEQAFA